MKKEWQVGKWIEVLHIAPLSDHPLWVLPVARACW